MGKQLAKPKSFKPGPDPRRNKKGRPPVPPDIKLMREQIRDSLVTAGHKYFFANLSELDDLFERTDLPTNEMLTIRAFWKSVRKGDMSLLNEWFNRVMGKPKEYKEHSAGVEVRTIADAFIKHGNRSGSNETD